MIWESRRAALSSNALAGTAISSGRLVVAGSALLLRAESVRRLVTTD